MEDTNIGKLNVKRSKLLKTLSVITLTIALILATGTTVATAYSVSSRKSIFTTKPGDKISSNITFTNPGEREIQLEFDWAPYSPQTGSFNPEIDVEKYIDVSLSDTSAKIAADGSKRISYEISIADETPSGTYDFVIYGEEIGTDSQGEDTTVGIRNGLGQIMTINVESSISLREAYKNIDIDISLQKRGIPYIRDTQFIVTITNNSQFTFTPEGEIRISDGENIIDSFRYNDEQAKLYPGDKIEHEYSSDHVFTSTPLGDKIIIGRIYSEYDDMLETSLIIDGYKNLLIGLGALMSIILVGVIHSRNRTPARK